MNVIDKPSSVLSSDVAPALKRCRDRDAALCFNVGFRERPRPLFAGMNAGLRAEARSCRRPRMGEIVLDGTGVWDDYVVAVRTPTKPPWFASGLPGFGQPDWFMDRRGTYHVG